MQDYKTITDAMKAKLDELLPDEAVTPHPTKAYLSNIKAIYVTERLNDVFGVGVWRTTVEPIASDGKMVVVKLTLTIPDYGVYYECFGGNDNSDLGDAYKGATTDALTKICSWMGLGAEVFKGKQTGKKSAQSAPKRQPSNPIESAQPIQPKPKKVLTSAELQDPITQETLARWLYQERFQKLGAPKDFDAGKALQRCYEVSDEDARDFRAYYDGYVEKHFAPR